MKNLKAMLLPTLVAAMMALSGCGDLARLGHGQTLSETISEVRHVAVVLQNGSNAPMTDGSVLELAPTEQDSVSVFCPDSTPSRVYENTYKSQATNNVYRERESQLWQEELNQTLANVRPDAGETDLLGTIRLCARDLQAASGGTRTLAILNNGIQTCAPLDMSQDWFWSSSVDDLVDQLDELGYTVDLSNVAVQFFYLGDCSGTQPDLSPQQVSFLQQFWQAYLTRCGADVTFHSDLLTGEAAQDTPSISSAPVIDGTLTPTAVPQLEAPAAVTLDQASLAFLPNSCEFADSTAAQDTLSQAAAQLLASTDTYTVAGSVALVERSDDAAALRLSQQRAATVRDAMVRLGVPADRLPNTVGLGTAQTSLRSSDEALNRCVYLVPSSNETLTAELLAAGTAA